MKSQYVLKRRRRIIISGGGTGGHFYPAMAISSFLKNKGFNIFYIGAQRGIEKLKIDSFELEHILLNAKGWNRNSFLSIFSALFLLISNIIKLFFIFRKQRPSLVICTGGYSSIAAGSAAALLGIPLYLQEQNAFPGLTNRVLSIFAKRIFISFENALLYFPLNTKFVRNKTIDCFNPVREYFKDSKKNNIFLFTGGSQGSSTINRLFLKMKNVILANNYKIILICGSRFYKDYSKYSNDKIKVLEYTEKPWEFMNKSKFIVSRCGALSISEIVYSCNVSVLIPYPFASGNHQYYNSELLINNNSGIRLSDNEIDDIDEINLLNTLKNSYNDYYKNIQRLKIKILKRDFFKVIDNCINEDIKL